MKLVLAWTDVTKLLANALVAEGTTEKGVTYVFEVPKNPTNENFITLKRKKDDGKS